MLLLLNLVNLPNLLNVAIWMTFGPVVLALAAYRGCSSACARARACCDPDLPAFSLVIGLLLLRIGGARSETENPTQIANVQLFHDQYNYSCLNIFHYRLSRRVANTIPQSASGTRIFQRT